MGIGPSSLLLSTTETQIVSEMKFERNQKAVMKRALYVCLSIRNH